MPITALPQLRYVQGALLLLVVFPTVLVVYTSSQAAHSAELCTTPATPPAGATCTGNGTWRVVQTIADIDKIVEASGAKGFEGYNGECAVTQDGIHWVKASASGIEPGCVQLVPVTANVRSDSVFTHGDVPLHDAATNDHVFKAAGETELSHVIGDTTLAAYVPPKLVNDYNGAAMVSILVLH